MKWVGDGEKVQEGVGAEKGRRPTTGALINDPSHGRQGQQAQYRQHHAATLIGLSAEALRYVRWDVMAERRMSCERGTCRKIDGARISDRLPAR